MKKRPGAEEVSAATMRKYGVKIIVCVAVVLAGLGF